MGDMDSFEGLLGGISDMMHKPDAEQTRKFAEACFALYNIYQGFQQAGFTETQAFELAKAMVSPGRSGKE